MWSSIIEYSCEYVSMNQALIENSGPDPSTPALLYASIPSRLLSIVLRIAG